MYLPLDMAIFGIYIKFPGCIFSYFDKVELIVCTGTSTYFETTIWFPPTVSARLHVLVRVRTLKPPFDSHQLFLPVCIASPLFLGFSCLISGASTVSTPPFLRMFGSKPLNLVSFRLGFPLKNGEMSPFKVRAQPQLVVEVWTLAAHLEASCLYAGRRSLGPTDQMGAEKKMTWTGYRVEMYVYIYTLYSYVHMYMFFRCIYIYMDL